MAYISKKRKKEKTEQEILFDRDILFNEINRVQIDRYVAYLTVSVEEEFVAENIIKDVGLKYEKTSTRIRFGGKLTPVVKFKVFPNPKPLKNDRDFRDIDELEDEILEDGQIFF